MARGRWIKPEFCISEQVAECSPKARLLFILMWMFCDDRGIHRSSMKTLKMECFPADDITTTEIRGLVDELVGQGLLYEYEIDGQGYLLVTGWQRHQKVEKPSYKYPCPDEHESSISRRAVVEPSESARANSKDKNSEDISQESQATEGYSPEVLAADEAWGKHLYVRYQTFRDAEDIRADREFLARQPDPSACVNLTIRLKAKVLKEVYERKHPQTVADVRRLIGKALDCPVAAEGGER